MQARFAFAAIALAPSLLAQDAVVHEARYPTATALEAGVSPEALARLDQLVQSLVDDGEIVGSELLVIKDGRSILHKGYGWRDREQEVPMEPGGVFCVRSMTKPLIGASIAMLLEEKLIDLDDKIAQYLPEFDIPGQQDITIENLLQHTSGLPMSLLLGKELKSLESIRVVAAMGPNVDLDFAPGSAFQYSDQGTDTLTALIEVVTGEDPGAFVTARLLEPLGMESSACFLGSDHPLGPRTCSLYIGAPGTWNRFWHPSEPTIFPFFLGSQGMFSSLEDYAAFLELYMRRGKVGKERLLKSRSTRTALKPGPYPLGASTGFPGLQVDYGSLMQLWTAPKEDSDEREVVAFGHTGSDGTHAWAFPDQKAMVLYFTQSRGTPTGQQVEEVLGELLLGAPFDPNQSAPPFEQYMGYFLEDENDRRYRAIVRDGDDLALEIVGRAVVPMVYIGEDRWKLRPEPSTVLAFERDEAGDVIGFSIGDHTERRVVPDPDLPDPWELADRVAQTHRLDLLESLGPIRMNAEIEMPKLGMSGTAEALLAWPDRFRFDSTIGEEFDILAFDGQHLRYASKMLETAILTGQRRELQLTNQSFARFGDWRRWSSDLRVIQRIEGDDGEQVYLVRTGGTEAPARTLYVDAATGQVRREAGFTFLDQLGRIGVTSTFHDMTDVSGMLLPFRTEILFAHPLLGTITSTVVKTELGASVVDGSFSLED